MVDFLFILLFSKTVLLTPDFITIDNFSDGYKVALNKPISAITSGASIQIDVSKMDLLSIKRSITETRNIVAKEFPVRSVKVTLKGEGEKVQLIYQGAILANNDGVRLVLSSDKIPIDVNFNEVIVRTNVELQRVKIYWKNYKK
jgi:hypothetical protein